MLLPAADCPHSGRGRAAAASLILVRIASLLPSATEIVYALGLDDQLVAVTFECDEPASARRDKAIVVGGRDTSAMAPGEIDAYVRAQRDAGADLYTLHADALAGLAPDLILTQDLCRVCAIPSDDVDAALAHLGCQADVLSLDPYSLGDVLTSIVAVGARTGAAPAAAALVGQLENRLAAVRAAVAPLDRPRVAVIEWIDPPFPAGHWIPDLVREAGGTPVACLPHSRSEPMTWDDVRAAEPDVAIVAPCGYRLDGAAEQARRIVDELPEHTQIWAIDADGIVVRPGPRLIEGVEAIAQILHPSAAPVDRSASIRRIR